MMKKIVGMLATLLLCFHVSAAPEFQEGKHYDVLSQPKSEQPEVLEFFSYFCPTCGRFEPIVGELKANLPQNVPFKKVPVSFLGREMGAETQRAFAVADELQVEDKVTPLLFNNVRTLRNRDDVRQTFIKAGVPAAHFDDTVDSFAISGKTAQYDAMVSRYKLRGVPAFIVNGKYMVKLESITSQAHFQSLVLFLLSKND
ncbi:thiol:disulfide interchange protein DsbA/DsbL [Aeromonas veronii]|uniref:thiol:disulfide interchange protein DsbA/DsbL n=1 Tax=Aeromonas veronii TaxID=654 RepID=UPI001F2E27AF|nr:thiol:disulfide interchange protein DsbA/DsbL [Aeromonas veronii]